MSMTVKRVSKTVKRVMTVMMISLIAMLGVEAEAHYIVVKGRCYWHSHDCSRQDKDVPDPVPFLFPPIGEVVATPKQVEILCAGGIVIDLSKLIDLSNWTLAARKPIVQSDITKVTSEGTVRRNAEWAVIVSDAHFLEDPTSTFSTFCEASGTSGPPQDVIIRAMSVKMNLYCSSLIDKKCFGKSGVPHSTWQADTCTLPDTFNFRNLPSRGTRYDCSGTSRCHEGVCEKL